MRAAVLWLLALSVASAVAAASPQRSFSTADEAAGALVQAAKAHDRAALVAILGPGSDEWISSGDAVADRAAVERFVAAYEQKHAIAPDGGERDAQGGARATLLLGPDDWPFAFPLVRSGAGWRFDAQAGKDELLARRIGQNELAAINVMLAIVDAQRDYASDWNEVPQYARKFASSPGKQDGLYWPTAPGEPASPLGALVTQAAGEGYPLDRKNEAPRPYHGYHFRMLESQGPNAAGGSMDYVVQSRMIGGFAAIAYPAQYGSSGVMTFLVKHEGVVLQKDLGPETAKQARAITSFDPGAGWTPAAPK